MLRHPTWCLALLVAVQGLAFGAEQEPGDGRLPQAFPPLPSWREQGNWQPPSVPPPWQGVLWRRNREGAEGERPRTRLYLSAALALGGGVLALWSGRRADEAYERYLRSAGSKRRERQFERAQRYDRIAGAAFVGMEAGIVLTTYLIFFSHGTPVDFHMLSALARQRLR
jgi:hypothetical protein